MTDAGARWRVLGAAVLFSTGGAAIEACSLSGWQVACVRSAIAAVALYFLVPEARASLRFRSTWLLGIAYAATLVLFVLATKWTTSANAIFLQSTAPLYLIAVGPFVLGERVSRRDVPFVVVIAIGVALFFVSAPQAATSAPRPVLGNILAAASGLSWAVTVMGLRWLGRDESRPGGAGASAIAGNVIAAVACLPFALPMGLPSWKDAAILLHLGVVQIGVAYAWLTAAMRRVPAFEAALLLLVEPVLNPLWAWWVQGEVPGGWSLLGGALILGASLARTAMESRRASA